MAIAQEQDQPPQGYGTAGQAPGVGPGMGQQAHQIMPQMPPQQWAQPAPGHQQPGMQIQPAPSFQQGAPPPQSPPWPAPQMPFAQPPFQQQYGMPQQQLPLQPQQQPQQSSWPQPPFSPPMPAPMPGWRGGPMSGPGQMAGAPVGAPADQRQAAGLGAPPQQSPAERSGQQPPQQSSGQQPSGLQQALSDGQHLLAGASGALAPAVQAVEQTGTQVLQSLLVAGLGALLSETTHAAAQQRAEQGLHMLVEKLFTAAPTAAVSDEMKRKTEGTLQLILRDALAAVFAERTRATVQQDGLQTIQHSLHGDVGGALKQMQAMLRALAEALIAALRRHLQTLARLAMALVLLVFEQSLEQPAKA